MSQIVFLSCTKSKLDKTSQAQDLYSASPMFRKTLEYGKSLKPDKMYILSAKHHLTPLTKMIAPYDLTLKDMKKDEKENWGDRVMNMIKAAGMAAKLGVSLDSVAKVFASILCPISTDVFANKSKTFCDNSCMFSLYSNFIC